MEAASYPILAPAVEADISEPPHRQTRLDEILADLRRAGSRGITGADLPAGTPLPTYISKLKRRGHRIATIMEKHDGPHAGQHARYKLVGGAGQ